MYMYMLCYKMNNHALQLRHSQLIIMEVLTMQLYHFW